MIGKNIPQTTGFSAFVPDAFPAQELFSLSPRTVQLDTEASRLVGKLDGITQLLPDVDFFLGMYVRLDATDSSQIEGTRATMIDAIEATGRTERDDGSDVDDILHYIDALNYGIQRLADFPLSLRFIREIHAELMKGARATHFADPGNFRKSQNWIGGKSPADAMFVPPPVHELPRVLSDFEHFLHTIDTLPPLVKVAYIHAHFETIHPFLDGNGRTGRILIALYLAKEHILEKPVLFLSSYFKKYRSVYYDRLTDYRNGGSEKWVQFFLEGVTEVATSAINTVKSITHIRERDIQKMSKLNKTSAASGMLILQQLFSQPIVSLATIQQWTGFRTRAGVQKLIDRFIELDILTVKDESKKYGRNYVYREYLEIFRNTLG